MRVSPRFALVAVLLLAAPVAIADHLQADCPLTLVASNPATSATDFNLSPHGVFRSGSQVFVLRGQNLTTYAVTDTGEMQVVREDFLPGLGARETDGGVAFSNGFLYVSGESGIDIYNLQGVRAGGTAPIPVTRITTAGHYRRLAVAGSVLAGLYPATDMPCRVTAPTCSTTIDLFNVSSTSAPFRSGAITTAVGTEAFLVGYNDITFNRGYLIATAVGGTVAYNVSNQAAPFEFAYTNQPGTFLVSNGTDLVGIGNASAITVNNFSNVNFFTPVHYFSLPPSLMIDRSLPLVFHPQAAFDESGNRLVTLIDEVNTSTLQPARTLAIDVFDLTVPKFQGSDPRNYEAITMARDNEIKYNPMVAGTNVYTVGTMTGLQTWGACGQMMGRIELDNVTQLWCGGSEIHGWVTGTQKVMNVELFLDNGSLGTATVSGVPRIDVPSATPVFTWRLPTNLDATTRGDHVLRLFGTDALQNRRQIATYNAYFPGAGQNCTARRLRAASH